MINKPKVNAAAIIRKVDIQGGIRLYQDPLVSVIYTPPLVHLFTALDNYPGLPCFQNVPKSLIDKYSIRPVKCLNTVFFGLQNVACLAIPKPGKQKREPAGPRNLYFPI